MTGTRFILLTAIALVGTCPLRADIFRWDNGALIPGTEGIEPGPGVQLHQRSLEFARLGFLDLSGASFAGSNIQNAELRSTTLTNADFSNANIAGARFWLTTSLGFTKEQLYSTASYKQHDLRGVQLNGNNLAGWDFNGQHVEYASFGSTNLSAQQLASTASYQQGNLRGIQLGNNYLDNSWVFRDKDLTGASFFNSGIRNVDFSGAIVAGVTFTATTGFSHAQLASTASYQQKSLQGIRLTGSNLTGWNFAGQDLTNAMALSHNSLNSCVEQGSKGVPLF